MSCTPEIVETKQVNQTQVAYRIVCCGEVCGSETCTPSFHACEDSWHDIDIFAEDHEARLQARLAEVAARHEKMKAWREKHKK